MILIPENWATTMPALWGGLKVTLNVAVTASLLTVLWASVVTWARLSHNRALRLIAMMYIELFRSTPIIVQIFIVFTVLPAAGLRLSPYAAAILALVLNAGGYLTENIRAAFKAIPAGLLEVADALGMAPLQKLRRVILPQSLKVLVPVTANTLLFILLTTPFVFLVGIQDMMMQANKIQRETGDFTVFLQITLIYVLISLSIHFVARFLERRLSSHF